MGIVRIPPVLRDVTGGSKEFRAGGTTVGEVLDNLFTSQPQLAARLTSDTGQLSPFLNVYLNGQDIRHRERLETPVEPDDVVILLPAMAGGCGIARSRPRRGPNR
jgi:molybdopterin converting factor small subunit